MILFTMLAITLVLLVIFVIAAVAAGGAMFIVVFADVIVCIAIMVFIMRLLIKRRK